MTPVLSILPFLTRKRAIVHGGNDETQDMCKLEMLRQDENSEWYEVRSSMRLVWLKAKQEIVPVEVICSFQRMHVDSPAGSSGSIVARLQRVSYGVVWEIVDFSMPLSSRVILACDCTSCQRVTSKVRVGWGRFYLVVLPRSAELVITNDVACVLFESTTSRMMKVCLPREHEKG